MNSPSVEHSVSAASPLTAFEKQAELAREALQNFNTIRVLNAPSAVKAALNELIHVTVRILCFVFLLSSF